MFVKDYMTRHPIMIDASRRVVEVQKLMADNNIRHLPVVGDGKRLVGLITRQRLAIRPEQVGSLDPWELTRYLADLTVGKVMISGADLQTLEPNATIEEAADLMIAHKISGVPVVDANGVLQGVITELHLIERNAPLKEPQYIAVLSGLIPIHLSEHFAARTPFGGRR